jgi:hypothetical protein
MKISMKISTTLMLILIALTLGTPASAQEHAPAPATPAEHSASPAPTESAPHADDAPRADAAPHTTSHAASEGPVISADGAWAGVMVMIALGLFLAAAVIGPIVRLNTPEPPPVHDDHHAGHDDGHGHGTAHGH